MNHAEQDLAGRSHAALEDAVLQTALKSATDTFISRRREAVAGVPEWQALRARARRVKEHTINNLDYYLEQLAEKVREHGGHVYWAATGEDVGRYCIELARARGVTSARKSKSIAAEETERNQRPGARGARPVETD